MIRIKAVTVLHSSSAKFQKGGVADKIGLCARSGPFNLFISFCLAGSSLVVAHRLGHPVVRRLPGPGIGPISLNWQVDTF